MTVWTCSHSSGSGCPVVTDGLTHDGGRDILSASDQLNAPNDSMHPSTGEQQTKNDVKATQEFWDPQK